MIISHKISLNKLIDDKLSGSISDFSIIYIFIVSIQILSVLSLYEMIKLISFTSLLRSFSRVLNMLSTFHFHMHFIMACRFPYFYWVVLNKYIIKRKLYVIYNFWQYQAYTKVKNWAVFLDSNYALHLYNDKSCDPEV